MHMMSIFIIFYYLVFFYHFSLKENIYIFILLTDERKNIYMKILYGFFLSFLILYQIYEFFYAMERACHQLSRFYLGFFLYEKCTTIQGGVLLIARYVLRSNQSPRIFLSN
jgi:hypothetical protein